MESKRLIIFFAIAAAILFGWEQMFPTPKPSPAQQQAAQNQQAATQTEVSVYPAALPPCKA